MNDSNEAVERLRASIGRVSGPTEWRVVSQDLINTFAEVSGDHQWIHVDVERAKTESPFGTTIAHGNLTLAMVDGFRDQLFSGGGGFKLGVNYGWNKVRFPAPVPAGSRVRATAETVEVTALGDGWHQLVQRFTIEVAGNAKPAFVGDSVARFLV